MIPTVDVVSEQLGHVVEEGDRPMIPSLDTVSEQLGHVVEAGDRPMRSGGMLEGSHG